MALVQAVQNGSIVGDSCTSSAREVNNDMGQDQFLQLLIAEMQNQDPLEPSSNTEWVSQMATFSMVESLNDMESAMAQQSANDLVGKYVILADQTSDGETSYVKGKVDYIRTVGGKTMLSVNDELYDISTLDTVADSEYYQGAILANEIHEMVQLLPNESNLSVKDAGLLKSAREAYDALTDTQKEFVDSEDVSKLTTLETKMDALKATYFTGLVKALPTDSDLSDSAALEAYTKQVEEARTYYNELTPKQKSNVSDTTVSALEAAEKAVEAAKNSTKASEEEADTVTTLLQQILDAVKNKN